MTANKRIDYLDAKVTKAHQARSAAFNTDKFDQRNRQLNAARRELRVFIEFCYKNNIPMDGEIPSNKTSERIKTRFESLPEDTNVVRCWSVAQGKWIYGVRGVGIAANLKDCI